MKLRYSENRGFMNTGREEGLRSIQGMHNGKLSSETGKIMHIAQSGCYLVRDEEKTRIMFLQNALDQVSLVVGVIASRLLTSLQKYIIGSLIRLFKEVACR